jgi:hypothetical protein
MPKKKQQTIAKRNREQAVAEKRRLKRERKQAVKAARAAGLDPEQVEYDPVRGEFIAPTVVDEEEPGEDAEPGTEAANGAAAEPGAEAQAEHGAEEAPSAEEAPGSDEPA